MTNSSDFRLVRLIPTTGTGSFSGGGGTFWDSAGVLQTAPANTLRVTYDPSDLSKAPYALVEPESTNLCQWSDQFTASYWSKVAVSVDGNVAAGHDGTVTADKVIATATTGAHYIEHTIGGPHVDGEEYTFSVYVKPAGINRIGLYFYYAIGSTGGDTAWFDLSAGTVEVGSPGEAVSKKIVALPGGWFRCIVSGAVRYAATYPGQMLARIVLRNDAGQTGFTGNGIDGVVVWGAQTQRGSVATSYIRAAGAPVTRGADVVGPGAGLVYSNVPITEPLWASGTYALGARVRDAAFLTYESQVANNTAALTDKTKWLPLGATNQRKAFDKAVNSQTTAAGLLAFAVKPGVVATTLMLLNMEGASVTVSQSDSGYVKTQSLVSHEVDNWYDFYYEEPVRAGDAVFTDIPPYPNSMLTVAIDNGPLDAKIGACLVGKPLTLGKVTASFSAGVLSYSTSTNDTFGNITMVKRYNAPRMNFDLMIPAGSEDFTYRVLREYTDTEIGAIVGDRFSMGIAYGFLGQWDVPKSGSGRTAPIEFKGLV